jgi:hypothetical protein
MDQLDLTARATPRNVSAPLSVDAQWVADKLSEYGFKMTELEALYPAAETVANDWAARGDELISIDLVTGEMRRPVRAEVQQTRCGRSWRACFAIAGPRCARRSR